MRRGMVCFVARLFAALKKPECKQSFWCELPVYSFQISQALVCSSSKFHMQELSVNTFQGKEISPVVNRVAEGALNS